jgi:Contractile injection system tube protein
MAINEQSIGNNLLHTINKLRIIQINRLGTDTSSGISFGDVAGGNLNALFKMFEVQINPDEYQRSYEIHYTDLETQAQAEPQKPFSSVRGESLSLSFTLDGTGVIATSATDVTNFAVDTGFQALNAATGLKGVGVNDVTYVTRRIEELKKVIYAFNPKTHEPPAVMVVWGDVHPFKGKLDSFQVAYSLFHPSGAPLRAKVTLQFSEHNAEGSGTAAIVAGAIGAAASIGASIGGAALSSPDLTHRRTVKATDTLPLLCEDVYRDASYYWQVAQANNLTHFRTLDVGSELFFPPIER